MKRLVHSLDTAKPNIAKPIVFSIDDMVDVFAKMQKRGRIVRRNKNTKYRIKAIDEDNPLDDGPLYWSNEWGWTNKKSASIFTQKEYETCYLPIGGKWEMVR